MTDRREGVSDGSPEKNKAIVRETSKKLARSQLCWSNVSMSVNVFCRKKTGREGKEIKLNGLRGRITRKDVSFLLKSEMKNGFCRRNNKRATLGDEGAFWREKVRDGREGDRHEIIVQTWMGCMELKESEIGQNTGEERTCLINTVSDFSSNCVAVLELNAN